MSELPLADVRARLHALESVRAAIARLAELGPTSELVDHAPRRRGRGARPRPRAAQPRRTTGALVAEALHAPRRTAAARSRALRAGAGRARLPAGRGRAAAPPPAAARARTPSPAGARSATCSAGRDYVAAPIVLEGRVIGFLHGDRRRAPPSASSTATRSATFALASPRSSSAPCCAAGCASSARRCARSRAGPTRARASSATARSTSRRPRAPATRRPAARTARRPSSALRDLLTRRELDVLELMVRGRDERRHRPRARRLRGHGQVPRQEHPAQAARLQPRRGDLALPAAHPAALTCPVREGDPSPAGVVARRCRARESSAMSIATSAAFERVTDALAGRPLRHPRRRHGDRAAAAPRDGHGDDERLWGTRALVDAPPTSSPSTAATSTSAATSSPRTPGACPARCAATARRRGTATRPVHWMDVARRGVRLARQAVERGRPRGRVRGRVQRSTATSTRRGRSETIQLLARAVRRRAARPDPRRDAVARARLDLRDRRARCWRPGCRCGCSFRRCRHGVCGVYGQHWGGPEGDAFGRAARRFEEMGVGALLVNCIPPDHVDRDGARGCATSPTCRSASTRTSATYPRPAGASTRGRRRRRSTPRWPLRWRAEGAQIIGGCCGVGARAHRGRARSGARGHRGRRRPARADARAARPMRGRAAARRPEPLDATRAGATCSRCRSRTWSTSPACSCRPRAASSSGGTCSRTGSARGRALPRRRLRHRPAQRPARAQRRRARARARPRRGAPSPTR